MLTCCSLCKSTRGYLARNGRCVDCGARPSDQELAAHGSAWRLDRRTGRRAIVTAGAQPVSFGGEFGDETAAAQQADDALRKDFTDGDYWTMFGCGVGSSALALWLLGAKGWWWLTMIPLSYVGIGAAGVAMTIAKAKSGDKVAQDWERLHGAPAGQLGVPAAGN